MAKKHGKNVRVHQRDAAAERAALEEAFEDRLEDDDSLAALVVAKDAKDAPFHRWHRYRQGFAPQLVALFLDESFPVGGPILDPFSGSGTVVIECARRRVRAIGIDAVYALALVASARFSESPVPDAVRAGGDDARQAFLEARSPLERAAVLLSESEAYDGEGRRKENVPPFGERLLGVLRLIAEDLARPLRKTGLFIHGDARAMPIADESIGGILTSPPYIAKYDYRRINGPLERVIGRGAGAKVPTVASSTMKRAGGSAATHPAVRECVDRLAECGANDMVKLLTSYIADMTAFIREAERVLAPSAPFWLNVAAADLRDVYVPVDLILAAIGEDSGLECESIGVARRLRSQGRRLGDLLDRAPREVVIRFRKP